MCFNCSVSQHDSCWISACTCLSVCQCLSLSVCQSVNLSVCQSVSSVTHPPTSKFGSHLNSFQSSFSLTSQLFSNPVTKRTYCDFYFINDWSHWLVTSCITLRHLHASTWDFRCHIELWAVEIWPMGHFSTMEKLSTDRIFEPKNE